MRLKRFILALLSAALISNAAADGAETGLPPVKVKVIQSTAVNQNQ